jgi:uncharacterized OB-fold protein
MKNSRPIRENLFVDGAPPRLLGSRCRETGETFYPAQVMNPTTSRAGTMEAVELPGEGTLVNFSVVARAAPGFESPYAMGIIRLRAGPTLTTQLAEWQGVKLRTGMAVELVIGPIRHDPDGTAVLGPKFRPVERSPQ